jgi:hypothetical protein
VPLWHGHEPFIEILEHEPIFHSVVWVGLDIVLEPSHTSGIDSSEVC